MTGNEPPEIINIMAAPSWTVNRSDMELFEVEVGDDLQYSHELETILEYKRPGAVEWENDLLNPLGISNGLIRWNMTIPADGEIGEWEIRAGTTDIFGEFSGYVTSDNFLTVMNRAPVVLIDGTDPLHFDADTTIGPINMSEYFSDPDGDDLEFTYNNPGPFNVDRIGDTINLTGPENWYGSFMFQIFADDGYDLAMTWINITVDPVNDPPVITGVDFYGTTIGLEVYNYTYSLFGIELYDLRRVVNLSLPEDDEITFDILATDVRLA